MRTNSSVWSAADGSSTHTTPAVSGPTRERNDGAVRARFDLSFLHSASDRLELGRLQKCARLAARLMVPDLGAHEQLSIGVERGQRAARLGGTTELRQ